MQYMCQKACDMVPLMRRVANNGYPNKHHLWTRYTSNVDTCNNYCGSDYKCDYVILGKGTNKGRCQGYSQGPWPTPFSPNGCEWNGWDFFNYDSWGGTCEPCPETKNDCYYMGLPYNGQQVGVSRPAANPSTRTAASTLPLLDLAAA